MRVTKTKRSIVVFAAGFVGVGVAGAICGPVASAAPPPCTAAELSATVSGVYTQTAQYLEAHPDANDALTQAGSMPADEAKASVRSYFFGHIDEYFALQKIAQPVADLKAKCHSDVSVSSIGALLDALNE